MDKGHDNLIMMTQVREEMERKRNDQLQIAKSKRVDVDDKRKKCMLFSTTLIYWFSV